jgi:hypothetical protein
MTDYMKWIGGFTLIISISVVAGYLTWKALNSQPLRPIFKAKSTPPDTPEQDRQRRP